MRGNPRKIKRLEGLMLVHGFSLSEVLRKELGISLTEFADQEGFRRSEVSMTINAHQHRIYQDIRGAFARNLYITPQEMDRLIDTYAGTRAVKKTPKKRA